MDVISLEELWSKLLQDQHYKYRPTPDGPPNPDNWCETKVSTEGKVVAHLYQYKGEVVASMAAWQVEQLISTIDGGVFKSSWC